MLYLAKVNDSLLTPRHVEAPLGANAPMVRWGPRNLTKQGKRSVTAGAAFGKRVDSVTVAAYEAGCQPPRW